MRRRSWAGPTRLGAALLGMLLAAGGFSSGSARADVAPSVMIVAGQSIGPVRLGMSQADVTSVLGTPTPADGGQIRFPHVGITVTLEDDAVVRVSTTNPQFRTTSGVGVGISLDDSARLIGDPNQAVAVDGNDTMVSYPFEGIGFVFRDGRAVEVFVVEAVARNPSLPPPPLTAMPVLPPGDEQAEPVPPLPPDTESGSVSAAQTAPALGASVEARDLAETVDAGRNLLHISGTLVPAGPQAVERVTVSARVFRPGGPADGETAAAAQMSLPPGGGTPFALDVSVAQGVVVQYAVEAVVSGAGTTSRFVLAQRSVSREAYADLARARVQVSVALGAPSNTGPWVQVLVSIGATGPIPSDWVREVDAEIPFTGGSTAVTLVPGQTVTILVPALSRVGTPQVERVVLNAS